jgi:hypothetical protein
LACSGKRRQASAYSATPEETLSSGNAVLAQSLGACKVSSLAGYAVALKRSLRNLCDEFLYTTSGKLFTCVLRKACTCCTGQELCTFASYTQGNALSTTKALKQRRRDGNCQCATTLVNALFALLRADTAVGLRSCGCEATKKLTYCNACWAERQAKNTTHHATTQSQAHLRDYFANSFTSSSERARQHIAKRANFAWVALHNTSTVLLNSTANVFSAEVTQSRANTRYKLTRSPCNI